MKYSLKTLIFSLGALVVLLWLVDRIGGPPISRRSLEAISVGMSKDQVLTIIGDPTSRTDDSFVYERNLNPGWVVITFSADETVGTIDVESVWR